MDVWSAGGGWNGRPVSRRFQVQIAALAGTDGRGICGSRVGHRDRIYPARAPSLWCVGADLLADFEGSAFQSERLYEVIEALPLVGIVADDATRIGRRGDGFVALT